MHWRTECSRHTEAQPQHQKNEWALPCVLFVLTVVVDLIVCALFANNDIGSHVIIMVLVMYTLAQFGASLYFFYGAHSLGKFFRVHTAQPQLVATDESQDYFHRMCARARKGPSRHPRTSRAFAKHA